MAAIFYTEINLKSIYKRRDQIDQADAISRVFFFSGDFCIKGGRIFVTVFYLLFVISLT